MAHYVVTLLCHALRAEFLWDPVWWEEEETTPKRYIAANPLIFSVWSQEGERIGYGDHSEVQEIGAESAHILGVK